MGSLGKRKAGEQGSRHLTPPEFARRLIESMHRMEVWGKLKELEFYIHLSPHADLNRDERDAVADCLECKFATGNFDSLQHDFMSKLTHLERTVRGRYEHVIDFLRPNVAPSRTEMTNYALKNMDAGNMKCMKDMLILEHAHRLNKVINNIISALGDQSQLGFEDARSVTLDIQEFVSYLYPWQRQILYLHLLISKNKSHPAEIAWAQDALMSPSIAAHVLDAMTTRQSTGESSALQKLTITINLVVQQKTYQQAGLIAARLREEAAELDKGEMDNLVVQIREAQELNAC